MYVTLLTYRYITSDCYITWGLLAGSAMYVTLLNDHYITWGIRPQRARTLCPLPLWLFAAVALPLGLTDSRSAFESLQPTYLLTVTLHTDRYTSH